MTGYTTGHKDTRIDTQSNDQDAPIGELLTVGEAAKIAGVYESRVARAMSTGRLPFVRVSASRYRFIRRADLEAWAAKQPQGG